MQTKICATMLRRLSLIVNDIMAEKRDQSSTKVSWSSPMLKEAVRSRDLMVSE